MPLRPLGVVKEIIEEQGLEISHVYDDLIFIEHNPFLLQFDELPNCLNLYFNVDCEPEAAVGIEKGLKVSALERELNIHNAGKYTIKPKEKSEELEIHFLPN